MAACASASEVTAPLSEFEQALKPRLEAHVVMLGGTIGERNAWHTQAYARAANYIETTFRDLGLKPRRLPYVVRKAELAGPFGFAGTLGQRLPEEMEAINIEAEIPGGAKAHEIVVVGAHYDSVYGSPGANDNGTGVAAVLEIARLLKDSHPARTVRLVAFANEEPPFFKTEAMGSRVYARAAHARGDAIVAMYSLETIGFYTDEPGSQRAPFPLGLFYPHTGNFVIFVSNIGSRALLRRGVATFRQASAFPAESFAGPAFVPGVDWSDQWSFWREDYPAVMVTDTAPYRYPYYHTAADTSDKIDYASFARIVAGLVAVIREIAND